MLLITLSLATGAIYILLQLFYLYHWHTLPVVEVPTDHEPQAGITVIIVAHNEEDSIKACIESVLQQHFPKHLLELIVIDDRSSDQTAAIVKGINDASLKFHRLSDYPEIIHAPAYKKSAVELGVHLSSFEKIVVTDADCLHGNEWLKTVTYTMEKTGDQFLTGPVRTEIKKNPIMLMQAFENLALMLITGAGIKSRLHDIANGANMAFIKSAFKAVNGYAGNYHYASGDDMFLIEKMRKEFPDQIGFIKNTNAIIRTKGKEDWTSLLKQRARWARKNAGLKNISISMTWMFVGFYHLLILSNLLLGFADIKFLVIGLALLFFKWFIDFIVIDTSARFFTLTFSAGSFIYMQILYMIYVFRLALYLLSGKKADWS